MKKTMIIVLAVASVSMLASAVSAEENILDRMNDANLNETLSQKYERVAYRSNIYDADGNIFSSYTYLEPGFSVIENEGNVTVYTDDLVYGFNDETKLMFADLYLDDIREYDANPVTGYMWDPDEILIESYEEDGKIIVHTQGASESTLADTADYASYLGYDVTEDFSVSSEYILDGKSRSLYGSVR